MSWAMNSQNALAIKYMEQLRRATIPIRAETYYLQFSLLHNFRNAGAKFRSLCGGVEKTGSVKAANPEAHIAQKASHRIGNREVAVVIRFLK